MKPHCLLAIVASLLAETVAAQPAIADVAYDGKWSATIQTTAGDHQSARFAISDWGGYWLAGSGRAAVTGSACAGKKLPITVQTSNREALEFTVWAAQVSPKCANLTIVTKPLDPKRLEGTVEAVGTIRLTRR